MDRPQLVHVVGLVGAAARVHEREVTRDEEGGLVVRHRERTGKDGAGLAVLPLTVGEEQGIRGAVAMPEMARLAHEAPRHRGVVRDIGAAADDEIVHDHPMADRHRRRLVAVHAAVPQAVHAADDRVVSDPHVAQIAGVADENMASDGADGRFLRFRVLIDHPVQGLDHFGPMPVHRHHIRYLRAEVVIDLHLAAARLVQDRHFHAVTESGRALRHDQVHVLQQGVMADGVVRDVVGYVLDEAVVPYRHIVQRGVEQAGVLLQSARELEHPLETAEAHRAGKTDVFHMLQSGIVHIHFPPVLRFASGGAELGDLVFSQFSVSHYDI